MWCDTKSNKVKSTFDDENFSIVNDLKLTQKIFIIAADPLKTNMLFDVVIKISWSFMNFNDFGLLTIKYLNIKAKE
jgi:hypothetical protein